LVLSAPIAKRPRRSRSASKAARPTGGAAASRCDLGDRGANAHADPERRRARRRAALRLGGLNGEEESDGEYGLLHGPTSAKSRFLMHRPGPIGN
jgi:hypothetical protein